MSEQTKAMEMALEALEYIRNFETGVTSQIKYGKAAQIIEEALALKQPAQRKPLTDEEYEALVEDLGYWSRYVEVDTAHQALTEHVRQVLAAHGIKENT